MKKIAGSLSAHLPKQLCPGEWKILGLPTAVSIAKRKEIEVPSEESTFPSGSFA
jgi:hypothetical protein